MKKYSKFKFIKVYVKAILLVGLLVAAGCTHHLLKTNAEAQKPRIKLGAYYFEGWGGKNRADDGTPEHAWAKGMPSNATKKLVTDYAGRMPVWGWRDDTQELMERQIDLAADNGISYFSFCWYWADSRGPINVDKIEADSKNMAVRRFMNAKNNNRMEFSLLVANHGGFEIVGLDAWKQAADYWIKNYFVHPRYLRVNGKPLVVIFSGGGGNAEGFAYLQEAAKKAGFPGVEIACVGSGNRENGYTLRAHYGIAPGWGQNPEPHPYSELIEASTKGWKGSPEFPYIPSLTVGCDPRPWDTKAWYYEGNTPEVVGEFTETLIKWMDEHPDQVTKDRLAVIYAWNEIGEGGELVPCKNDPDGAYLKAIRKALFKK